MKPLLALLAWLLLATPSLAQSFPAVFHPGVDITGHVEKVFWHGYSPCPQGVSLGDGCPGLGGNFLQTNFATHAQQSGQTWTSSHPWSWNAPGVDYAVGYYTSLLDPTLAGLPSGCALNATGSALGGPIVVCQSTSNLTVSGYDFSLHNCVPLEIKSSATGNVTITDNRFKNGSNCSITHAVVVGSISGSVLTVASVTSGTVSVGDFLQGGPVVNTDTQIASNGTGSGGTGTYNLGRSWTDAGPSTYYIGNNQGYLLGVVNGSTANYDIENNYFDGDALNFPISLAGLANVNSTGTLTLKYNAFLRCPCRPVSDATFGSILVEYNYFEDYVFQLSDGHGEVVINSIGSGTVPSTQYSYNVALEGSTTLEHGGTTNYYLAGGTVGTTYTAMQADHNIGIANLSGGGYTLSTALAEIANGSVYTNVTLQDNFIDATGALNNWAFVATGSNPPICTNPPTFSGNVSLTNGSSRNAWDSNNGTGC